MNESNHESAAPAKGTLFFDGECGLCTRSVRFLLWADPAARLRFAPLQGETARALLPEDLRDADRLSTVVYLRGVAGKPQLHVRTDAVAWALIDIGGVWKALGRCLRVVPKGLREPVYIFIAKHRMRLFPKGACPLPSQKARARLLD